MKYLAILKDCVLEALDTKVFYVMVGLSCLVLVVIGSVSYKPVSVEDEVRSFATKLTWAISFQAKDKADKMPRIEVADFEQTNPDGPPTERDYAFTLIFRMPDPEMAKAEAATRQFATRGLQKQLSFQFQYLDNLEVSALDAPDPAELRFRVTTHGSKVKRAADWPHEPTIFFALPITIWHGPVGRFVHFWEDTIVNQVGAGIALLISSIITAFFIPNMLRKGTIDLLLVKPIHRTTLLIYKYIGGLMFMFLNTSFVVCGIWLILGLRTGMSGAGFLASIPVLTFEFALYYAVSTLFGVVTRSSIAAILMTCFAWFLFSFVIGNAYQVIDATRKLPELAEALNEEQNAAMPRPFPDWVYTSADVIHFVTPRLKDLDALTNKLIVDDTVPEFSKERKMADKLFEGIHWTEALTVTTLYIAVLLALSCTWFALKDY